MSPKQKQALAARRRTRKAHPLRFFSLWERKAKPPRNLGRVRLRPEVERSSQAWVFREHVVDALAVVGGNGSSKTWTGAVMAVCCLLGRDHPDVQALIERHGLNADLIPPDGGLVIASSLNSAMSVNILRPLVAQFAPDAEVGWRNRDGQGEAVCYRLDDPTKRIIFKSNDQGWEKYQGYAACLVWLDEEHDQKVYRECQQRVGRVQWETSDGLRSGWILLTMTPLKGKTWVWDEFAGDARAAGTAIHFIWGGDNPHVDQGKRSRMLDNKSISGAMRAARDRGAFGDPEGLVWSSWRRSIHVADAPIVLDPHWLRYDCIDFGTRHPLAWLMAAYSTSTDTLYLLRLIYQPERLISEHVDHARALWRELGEEARQPDDDTPAEDLGRPELVWADPEDKQSRRSLALEHSIVTRKATKEFEATLQAGLSFLRIDEQGPHLVVDPRLAPFIREIEGYQWAPQVGKGDAPNRPIKKDDHAMDTYRYLTLGIRKQHG
jgi:phage terminase large subunit-like protein